MKKERSYGAVVYRYEGKERLYLIENMRLGHVSLPKGHIEAGETPLQCTLREIKEETNLDVNVDMSFSHTITYSPSSDVSKDVTFFVAEALSEDLIPQPEEVSSLVWAPFEKAYKMLTFDTDKETLKDADTYLTQHA
ncbi:MAG: NUDIX domain-containing protein [Eubacteriales bacterium]|nr:NUDIX domain-containing protein [Eubacteriales bacterium]